MFWRIPAAMTQCHRPGGLSNKYLFLTVLETGKSKIKLPTKSVPGEDSLSGLQTAAFSLCVHMAERERKRESSGLSFPVRALIPV